MSEAERSGVSRIVPDTSVIIKGKISELIESGELDGCEIVIPLAVIDELQAQASKGREIGIHGLEEIKRVRELAGSRGISIRFSGERPGLEDIKLARSGRIDALIRDVAKAEGAVLYTCDYVQALVAEAEGVPVKYIEPYELAQKFSFEEYLTPNLIALQLKAGSPPYGKVLEGGKVKLVKLRDTPCSEEELNKMIEEVVAASRISIESDVTMLRSNAIIIETDKFRVSVAKPPFSDSFEVTIQRNPMGDLLTEEVVDAIVEECTRDPGGTLILNADGLYSFPIAERIGEKIRDLGNLVVVIGYSRRSSTSLPYYGGLNGDLDKTVEFIALNKPDYVIFDELRKPRDFQLIRSLRASGINVVAFLSSRELKLALENALEKIPLPQIPHVIQKIIEVKCGQPIQVYRVSQSIRAPMGLTTVFPGLVVYISKGEEPVLELYSMNGQIVIRDLSKVFEDLRFIERSVKKVLRSLRKTDPGVFAEKVALDKVVFRVARSKLKRLEKLLPKLEERLGVTVELAPR